MLDVVYYVTSFLTVLGLPLFALAIVISLIRPAILNKKLSKTYTRKRIASVGVASLFVATIGFGTVLGATEPESVKQARIAQEATNAKALQLKQQEEETKQKADASKPVVKTETKKETVAFESTEQNSATLAQGQKQVSTQGVNGERTIAYEITYIQGKETARKEIKNEVTKQPVTQITLVGTYVAPAPVTQQTTTTPTTQSSSGARTGATCNDGSRSNATGRGACSHHGGVAYWLYG
jgi:hypothetical protein